MPAFLRIRRRIFLLPLLGFCRNWLGVSGFNFGIWPLVLIPHPWRAGCRGGGWFSLEKQLASLRHLFPAENHPPPRRRQRFLGGSVNQLFVGGCHFLACTVSCTVQHSVQGIFYGRYQLYRCKK